MFENSRPQQLKLVYIVIQAGFDTGLFMAAPELSAKEVITMDDMQKSGETPQDILSKLQRDRAK